MKVVLLGDIFNIHGFGRIVIYWDKDHTTFWARMIENWGENETQHQRVYTPWEG